PGGPRRAAAPAHPPVGGHRGHRYRGPGAHRRCARRPARRRRDQRGGEVGAEPVAPGPGDPGPGDPGPGGPDAADARPAPDRLGARTWTELPTPAPLLLVPIGATEQHGPHLPLDTDTRIAAALAARAAHRCDALLAPAL